MALPVKIPSNFRRTPIVKKQNPALYSTSATQLDSENEFNNNYGFGTLNNYVMRYRSLISVAARMIGLRSDVSFFTLQEEATRFMRKTDKTTKEIQIAGSINFKLDEAALYRQLIINTVEEMAKRDSVNTRAILSQLFLNNSFKTELNQLIDRISTSTSGLLR